MIVYVPARQRRSLAMDLARYVAWLAVGVLAWAALFGAAWVVLTAGQWLAVHWG